MRKESCVTSILSEFEKPLVSRVKKEIGKETSKERFGEKISGTKWAKKAISVGVAALMVEVPVVMAEVNLSPKNAIVVEGVMSSQLETDLSKDKTLVSDEGLNKLETISIDLEKEVNQRFIDFLAGKGEYREDNLNKTKLLSPYVTKKDYVPDLGFYGYRVPAKDFGYFDVQGLLLGHYKNNESEFLAVGVKDRSGKRNISVMEVMVEPKINVYSEITIEKMLPDILGQYYKKYYSEGIKTSDEFSLFLDRMVGKIMLFSMITTDYKSSEVKKHLESVSQEVFSYHINNISPRVDGNIQFASGLLIPPNEILKKRSVDLNFIKKLKKGKLRNVESYSDFLQTFNENGLDLPLVEYIWCE